MPKNEGPQRITVMLTQEALRRLKGECERRRRVEGCKVAPARILNELIINHLPDQVRRERERQQRPEIKALSPGKAADQFDDEWICDLEGRCLSVGQKRLQFTGTTIEQQLGDGWERSLHPDDLSRIRTEWLKKFNARKPYKGKYRIRRHDGVYGWFETEAHPQFTDGQFAGYHGTGVLVALDVEGAERAS